MKGYYCIITLLLLAALLLCGCGGNGSATSSIFATKEPAALTPEPTEAPTPEPTETLPAADDIYGSFSGARYENGVFGIGFEMNGWSFKTKEEIAELYDQAVSITTGELKEKLKNSTAVTIMYGESADSMDNVCVQVKDFDMQGYETDDEFTDRLLDEVIGPMNSMLEGSGIEDLSITKSTVELFGKDTPCLAISGSYYGILAVNIRQAYFFLGDYIMVITASSYVNDTRAENVCRGFYLIDSHD